MRTYNGINENKIYVLFIFLIFLMLIFIKNSNNTDKNYEKIVIEREKREENINKLRNKINEKEKELKEIQLKILELKFQRKQKKLKKNKIEIKDKRENIKKLDLSRIKSYYLNWPINSKKIKMKFGEKTYSLQNKNALSRGVEIGVNKKENIYSGVDGVVLNVGESENYGNFVDIVRDDGLKVRYGNLDIVEVVENQKVKSGEILGVVSGNEKLENSFYYEVLIENIPVDPMRFKYNY